MILELRAKLPDRKGLRNKYFYQKNQYLTSFLRRVLTIWGVSHPTYLDKELEDILEIKIDGKWLQCEMPEYFRGEGEQK